MVRFITDEAQGLPLAEIGAPQVAVVDGLLRDIHAQFAEEKGLDANALRPRWRAWTRSHEETADRDQVIDVVRRARKRKFAAFLLLGVGGSDLAPRVIHETLDHPFHNSLEPKERSNAPEIHFGGDTFDPRPLRATLDKLEAGGLLPDTLVNVVSRSGKTAETFAAMMVVQRALEAAGRKGNAWRRNVVATTLQADSSLLYQQHNKGPKFFGMLPVPEGVGGRFSVASPVGLLTLAIASPGAAKGRVSRALKGFRCGHEQCFDLPALHPDNTAFRLARWLHLAEEYAGKTTLVFYNYASDRHLGDWFTQLYSESIQERGGGMNVIATRGPTGNHSILNGIIGGRRDKVVLFIWWQDLEPGQATPLGVPDTGAPQGDLAALAGLPFPSIQEASWKGTAADLTANRVPNATLIVPRRDPGGLFNLMRVLMDAVAIKGRLQGLHYTDAGEISFEKDLTYQQDSVEGYKERMRTELARIRQKLGLPPV